MKKGQNKKLNQKRERHKGQKKKLNKRK